MSPEENLMSAFWRIVKDDLNGEGIVADNLKGPLRRLPYGERATIERQQLKASAEEFVLSDDFDAWAGLTGIESKKLRDRLYDSHT